MRVGGAVAFLQCRDGGFELGLDGRALATGQAAAQLGPQFLDVLVKRDHRPLLLFEDGAGAPPRSRRDKDRWAAEPEVGGAAVLRVDGGEPAATRCFRAASIRAP